MNEPDTTTLRPFVNATGALIVKTESKKKRKARVPRAPRVLDPGIQAIHDAAKLDVKNYRRKQASAKLLATIVTKRLPQLTQDDRNKLADALRDNTTLNLIPANP